MQCVQACACSMCLCASGESVSGREKEKEAVGKKGGVGMWGIDDCTACLADAVCVRVLFVPLRVDRAEAVHEKLWRKERQASTGNAGKQQQQQQQREARGEGSSRKRFDRESPVALTVSLATRLLAHTSMRVPRCSRLALQLQSVAGAAAQQRPS